MSQGIFATPNIGSAGSEVAQVQPEVANTAGIPTDFENVASAAKPILHGAYEGAAFVESRQLKSEAEKLSTQFAEGFKNDAAAQGAAQTLGQMKQAVIQGQMTSSSMLIRAKAIQDKAKGLSPHYGPEIDEVFAKNGIDPNGRNGLGTSKTDYATEELKDKIKTATAWHRDPSMSQYVVYQPGAERTENNIDVNATLDNVAKVNDTMRATEQGVNTVVSTTLATIDSQLSNKLSQLQQSKGDPGQIAVQQQEIVGQFKNQVNQLISFSLQNLSKFPPGSDQYKNITAQIAATRAFKNDLETMTPSQLVAAKNNADMVGAQLASVSGKYEISYYESGLKALKDLSDINANGLSVIDISSLKIMQDKINNGQELDPITEQPLYDLAKSPASMIRFINTNGKQPSYSQMETSATQLIAQTDNQALTNFMSGKYNQFTDKEMKEDTKKKLASNAARLFDGAANTGMFVKNPDNYINILKQTSNSSINELLSALPKEQRDIAANNLIKTSLNAMTGSSLPFSIPQLKANGTKIFIDERTNTIGFGGSKSNNPVSGLPNEYQPWQNASTLWNNALQTMVNVAQYDPSLKGKSKSEIVMEILKQNGYPEDLIEIKQ